ncbi:endonuclease Q family protein [Halegenticoccus soli]|nr:endonuclease Q family protein [Halegenticoccus soli]
MSTTNVASCPNCDWTGTPDELDDRHGRPACPNCGRRVTLA